MKKIAFVITAILFAAFFVRADVIKLKNGKVYKGFIMYYENGKYTVLMNNKKYPLDEDSVESIKWESNDAQIAAAYKGEPLPQKKKRGYDTGSYAKAVIDFVAVSGAEEASITGGMQVFPSIEYGWILGPVNFGIQLGAGFNGGKGHYYFYTTSDGDVNGEYDISRTVLLLMLTNTTTFDLFGDSPLKIFLGASLGGGFTSDSLENYPVLTDYYTAAQYSDKTEMYPTFAIEGKLGLMYGISDKIKASAFIGYRAMSGNAYLEPQRESEFESDGIFGLMAKTTNFGGILFGLDCSYIF